MQHVMGPSLGKPLFIEPFFIASCDGGSRNVKDEAEVQAAYADRMDPAAPGDITGRALDDWSGVIGFAGIKVEGRPT